jgi:uncharacterized protein YuzE
MRITWDKKAKAVYIYLTKNEKVEETEKVSDTLYIDYRNEYPVGLEILDVEEIPIVEKI